MVAEGTASLVIIGFMALWVRANRLALALLGKPSQTEMPFRAWVAYCPPVVPRGASGRQRRKQTGHAVRNDVQGGGTCFVKSRLLLRSSL
jgi:hypothetical protein